MADKKADKKNKLKGKKKPGISKKKADKKQTRQIKQPKGSKKQKSNAIDTYKKWIFCAIITLIIIFLILLFFVLRIESSMPYTKVFITNTTVIGNVIKSIL